MSDPRGTGRVDGLAVPGDSPVHRLDAAAKLAGLVGFVVIVAVTPRRAVGLFVVDAALVVAAVVVAGIPARVMLTRLVAVVPFVAFAFALPFIGSGPQVDVAGVSMAAEGLWAAWGIVAKALLGAAASILVVATTSLPELLRGLGRLRMPAVMVAIVAVMVRYVDLVADQLARMRRAMTARGHDPRWFWQARPIASSVGTLFVRSYERGERVHLAMVARGFDGHLPPVDPPAPASRVAPVWAAVPALVAALDLVAWVMVT